MPLRKPGTCHRCGAPTQRTSNTRCKACAFASDTPDTLFVSTPPSDLTLTSDTPLTLASALEAFGLKDDAWTVKAFTQSKRESAKPSYTVRVRVVPKAEDGWAAMRQWWEGDGRVPAVRVAVPKVAQTGYLLELAVPDLHLGKLAWSKETGGANYDSKIAVRLYKDAIEALLARTSAFTPERIVLVVGNDFFHSDTKAGTTTKGTPLDVDGRFPKMFAEGLKLITTTAERLAQIAPVTLIMVRGNHDELSNYCLGEALAAWFRNTPAVTVENAPTPRKYFQWGSVMLGWTHGDKGRFKDLPLLMATEQPAMFGATKFREFHTGDKHQIKVQEQMGIRVRISPALCAPDAWHSESHFVGNQRAAEAFVWDRTEGLVAQASYTAK